MIRTVLVDIDNTILDFTKGERKAIALTFAELGLRFAPRYAQWYHDLNVALWARYDKGELPIETVLKSRFEQLFKMLGWSVNTPADMDSIYEKHLCAQHDYVHGAKGFLERLRSKYKVYAVSNGREEVQVRRLKESGLDKLIDGCFTSQRVGYHKPQVEFFDYVASHIPQYDPTATVLIGDSLTSDIQGGKNAGVKTIWFNRESLTLVGEAPDFESTDFHAIEDYIDSL